MSIIINPTHANLLVGFSDPSSVLQNLGVSSFDTLLIESVAAGGMNEIRHFIAKMQYGPQYGSMRLGVITCYEQLSTESQNALLKLLEEPPPSACVILFVPTIATVLPTVRSRCQVIYSPSYNRKLTPVVKNEPKDTLDAFCKAETLAKSDALLEIVEEQMFLCHREWSQAGWPLKSVDKVENFFNLYHNLKSTINKRILLEQHALNQI